MLPKKRSAIGCRLGGDGVLRVVGELKLRESLAVLIRLELLESTNASISKWGIAFRVILALQQTSKWERDLSLLLFLLDNGYQQQPTQPNRMPLIREPGQSNHCKEHCSKLSLCSLSLYLFDTACLY
jgi:hypothetical protein